MSIKQSIAALFLLLSVSFSAFSSGLATISGTGNLDMPFEWGETYAIDSMIPTVHAMGCIASAYKSRYRIYTHTGTGSTFMNFKYTEYVDSGCTDSWSGGSVTVKWTNVTECPEGQEVNEDTGKCEEPPYCERESTLAEIEEARNSCESSGQKFELLSCSNETEIWESKCDDGTCEDKKGQDAPGPGFLPDDGLSLTASRLYCVTSTMCEGLQSYYASAGDLIRENFYTGNDCVGTEDDYTDNPYYVTDTDGDGTDGTDGDDVDFDDPIHDPMDPTSPIDDPQTLPDWDGGGVPIPPKDTGEAEEVEDPLIDPDIDSTGTDTAVVKAITGMNADINKALNDLNLDINQSSADVQNQIQVLNGLVVQNSQTIQDQQKNDNRIYENTKALIQQANADITTAVNKNTNAINGLGDALEGIEEGVEGIGDAIDGLANLDVSGAVNGSCPFNSESESCNGYYESGYPDGFEGLVDDHFSALQAEVTTFVDGMFALDVSNGTAPGFCMNVMQFGNFCFTDYFDLGWVFTFVRACMMFSTVMLCRRLVFGG